MMNQIKQAVWSGYGVRRAFEKNICGTIWVNLQTHTKRITRGVRAVGGKHHEVDRAGMIEQGHRDLRVSVP